LKNKKKLQIHHHKRCFWGCFSLYTKDNLKWVEFKKWKDTIDKNITVEIGFHLLPFISNYYDLITTAPPSKNRKETFYCCDYLCQWLSERSGIPFKKAFKKRRFKSRHGVHESLNQEKPLLREDFKYSHKSILFIDDFLNTGMTAKLCYEALRVRKNHIDGLVFCDWS